MLSGARFSIHGLAAQAAGAASSGRTRSASASRRMSPTLAQRLARGLHVEIRAHAGDLAVGEPHIDRGVLLHVDAAGRPATREAHPDGDRVAVALDLERLEANVVHQALEAGEVAPRPL